MNDESLEDEQAFSSQSDYLAITDESNLSKNLAPIGSEWKLKKLLSSPDIWLTQPRFPSVETAPETIFYENSTSHLLFGAPDENYIPEENPNFGTTETEQAETKYVDAVRAFAKNHEVSHSSSPIRVLVPRRK